MPNLGDMLLFIFLSLPTPNTANFKVSPAEIGGDELEITLI